MKKYITLAIVLMLSLLLLTACGCEHEWADADCNDPKTCEKCGKTEGDALGHNYEPATCEAPETCKNCGKTEGSALGHTWVDATCETPKTCSVCKATEGQPLAHKASMPTCTEPSTCSVCNKVIKEANGHTWTEATCEASKTCSVCKAVEGAPKGHTWVDATCETPKTCSVCQKTEGTALPHNWAPATTEKPKTCTVCGKTEGDPLFSPPTDKKMHLGVSLTDYVSTMNTSLNKLGYKLVEMPNDQYVAYNVVTNDAAATPLNVQVIFYLYSDNSTVMAVACGTDYGADNTASTVTGNCFGIAAVIADKTFGQADIQALQNNASMNNDQTVLTYTYEKNGIAYAMVITQTSATQAELVTTISPAK